MDIEKIDEVESLIEKYRVIEDAKKQVGVIDGEYGGDPDTFTLMEKDTGIEIDLPHLKADCVDAITRILTDQFDKVIARLKQI